MSIECFLTFSAKTLLKVIFFHLLLFFSSDHITPEEMLLIIALLIKLAELAIQPNNRFESGVGTLCSHYEHTSVSPQGRGSAGKGTREV